MLVAAREIHHLPHLGLCNLVGKHAHNREAFFVYRKHQLERLRVVHSEEPLQHMHHKFHRRVVVIQKHDFIKRRPLGLRLGLGQQAGIGTVLFVVFVSHGARGISVHTKRIGLSVPRQRHHIGADCAEKRAKRMGYGAKLAVIGFDADDTLWQNERFFRLSQNRFEDLLADFAEKDHLAERLLAAERRNLGHYGFGVKGFTLSMIETALEITEDRVPVSVIRELIEIGQDLLAHPIELLPHAKETVETLAGSHRILLITKGDLLDQERKLAQSGLGDLFDGVEIVSDKTPATYAGIFGSDPALMAGNSLKSDVIPALEAGAWGVHIPHDLTWALEHAEAPQHSAMFRVLHSLEPLPALVEEIESTT